MGLSPALSRSVRTLVAIRVAVWVGTALTLVWAPFNGLVFGDAYGTWSNLLFRAFAQWDARWFVQIADRGYAEVPEAAAFFPLYPAAVHALAWVTGSTLVAGTLISLASAAVAAAVLAELARLLLGERAVRDTVLYVALYPVAFVFTAVYSDALFLALAAASFLAAERGRPVLAGVLVGLATGTRLIGLALVPALALLLWRGRGRVVRLAPLLLAPAAVGLYALYLGRTIGDAEAFARAQVTWDRHAATLGPFGGIVDAVQAAGRGLKTLASADAFGQEHTVSLWNVSHLALLVAAVALTIVAWQRIGPAYGLYSAVSLVVILSAPATGFPLVSLPRLLLADFPVFLALAALTLDRPRARETILYSFAAAGAAAAIAFSRGIWIA
ncbi:MAG: mannosyltransferase family protein [Gaiellaceae bacterium]